MSLQQKSTVKARSWLFTPATRPERFAKSKESGADVLIVDLEDAVSPDDKDGARANVEGLLEDREKRLELPKLAIRINNPHGRFGHDDLSALAANAGIPDFVLVPKVESAEQVQSIASFFHDLKKPVQIVPLIESVRGLKQVDLIAQSGSVFGLMFGAADYASDARLQPDSLGLQLARCAISAACACAVLHHSGCASA